MAVQPVPVKWYQVYVFLIHTCVKHIKIKKIVKTFKNICFCFFIFVEQAYTSPASLKCNGHFSCSEKCQTAYTAGSDGCPQCDCVPGACLIMRTWNQKWTEHPCRCYVFISLVHLYPVIVKRTDFSFILSCSRTPVTYKIHIYLYVVPFVVTLYCFLCFHSANKQSH